MRLAKACYVKSFLCAVAQELGDQSLSRVNRQAGVAIVTGLLHGTGRERERERVFKRMQLYQQELRKPRLSGTQWQRRRTHTHTHTASRSTIFTETNR